MTISPHLPTFQSKTLNAPESVRAPAPIDDREQRAAIEAQGVEHESRPSAATLSAPLWYTPRIYLQSVGATSSPVKTTVIEQQRHPAIATYQDIADPDVDFRLIDTLV